MLDKKEGLDKISKELSKHIIEERGKGMGVGGPRQGDGGTDTCLCPECGTTSTHQRGTPCTEQKCPKCGASMAGASNSENKKESLSKIAKEFSKAII